MDINALMAAGVSVTWGVLRIINLAHFGLILLGSYLTFELASAWEINPLVTLVVSVPAMFSKVSLPPLVFTSVSPLKSRTTMEPPEVRASRLPLPFSHWIDPPLVATVSLPAQVSSLMLPPLVRASVHYTTTDDEIDRLVEVVAGL